jgi:peptidoglycan hydrolase-like protein with peptidoglycan-binding domain
MAMRVLILALSVLGILVSANAANAGLSTTTRDPSVSVDPAAFTDEATQQTEDQIGLDKKKRRAVQRRLTALGFATKVNGKLDEPTRAAITRWQGERGYPGTGFLNTAQYKALLTETVSKMRASADDEAESSQPARRHRGGHAHHHRAVGGPIGVIGGMVGGLFGRR